MEDEFYIGWQEQTPLGSKVGRKRFFFIALAMVLLFASGYLFVENKFADSYFDFGNLTEIDGTVVTYPVFGLKTEIEGREQTVPLVGFGKSDALPVLESIEKQANGQLFKNLKVKLRGTIISYQDKVWMELTEGNESIVSIQKASVENIQKIDGLGTLLLSGEIIDPKCFFGVMNPAYKKIHRSCAIRCISGGIPPLLGIREGTDFVDYYFVTDENGLPLNQDILQLVGRPVNLLGQIEQVDDWKVIKVNRRELANSVSIRLDNLVAICGPR